jgi:hypothetical protein
MTVKRLGMSPGWRCRIGALTSAACLLAWAALPALPGRPGAAVVQQVAGTVGHSPERESSALRGIPAYVPVGARANGDDGVLDVVPLMAIPLVRTETFPGNAPAGFFSAHGLTDRQFVPRLRRFLDGGGRALITSQLASRLGSLPGRYADRVFILTTTNGTAGLMKLPQTTLDRVRNFILFPMGLYIQAPPRVVLTLYGQHELRVKNFNAFAAGLKVSFRRPIWPEITAIRTDDGEASIPVDFNLAQLQIAPRATRALQIVARP